VFNHRPLGPNLDKGVFASLFFGSWAFGLDLTSKM
jgi:hypothetical protein